jgi:hypothetical protein
MNAVILDVTKATNIKTRRREVGKLVGGRSTMRTSRDAVYLGLSQPIRQPCLHFSVRAKEIVR